MVNTTWTFLEYVNQAGDALFTKWLQDQKREAQAQIDARILLMRGMAPPWPPKWISAYKGYDKLFELRITFQKIQYRPLGCYGPDKMEFTLLAGAIEKDWKLPRGVLDAAMDRMKLVLEDRGRWTREYNFDTAKSVEKTAK
jgi:hypothetical protein